MLAERWRKRAGWRGTCRNCPANWLKSWRPVTTASRRTTTPSPPRTHSRSPRRPSSMENWSLSGESALCFACRSLRAPFSAAQDLSLARAATSIIFVATKLLSQQTRVWRDKSKLVATKVCLSWQNFFAFVLLSSGANHNKKQTWGVFSCVCVCHSVSRYNGHLTAGDKGRRRSKYILWKRTRSNGVKPSKRHLVSDPKSSKVNCLLLLVCWSPPHHHYHQHSHLHPFQEVVWPSG